MITRTLYPIALLTILSFSTLHTEDNKPLLVPSVLLEYSRDALFTTVFVNQLAQTGRNVIATELPWILNSDAKTITEYITSAHYYAEKFDAQSNSEIGSTIFMRNLPALKKALETTQRIMESGNIYLSRYDIKHQLFLLLCEVGNVKDFGKIDGSREFKQHNPRRYAFLSEVPSLDTLHARVAEELGNLKETA